MGKRANSSGKRGRSSGDAGGGGGGGGDVWGSTDHEIRKAKHQRKVDKAKTPSEKQLERDRRTAVLTRGSEQKIEEGKIRLHIKRVQRQIDTLRRRLEKWDDKEEKRIREEQILAEQKKRNDEEMNPSNKKKGRKGPETWKLKGAARPAHLVYDFDTRYVDPHIKAHEEARQKAQRCRNIFTICKGKFGEEDEEGGTVPQPFCREFLSLLMQLGNLSMQANQLKTARQSFLECMELDSTSTPITPARCQLMRMYLDANRPDSARRLWERLGVEDRSVWIRYSAALIEYVSWKILGEEGSTEESAELLLAHAVKANLFCAYYLAFFDTFHDVMDYTDDIEDAHEGSPLEEAIEYCNSEQMGAWHGTEGALEWIRSILLRTIHSNTDVAGGKLVPSDLEWREKLSSVKEAMKDDDDDDNNNDDIKYSSDGHTSDDEVSKADLEMFAGMFETAMEMLEESGSFEKKKE